MRKTKMTYEEKIADLLVHFYDLKTSIPAEEFENIIRDTLLRAVLIKYVAETTAQYDQILDEVTKVCKRCAYDWKIDRFTGTRKEFNNKINSLKGALSQAYNDYTAKCNSIDPSLELVQQQALRAKYKEEYTQTDKSINAEIQVLKAAWKNQQSYLSEKKKEEKFEKEMQQIMVKYKLH